MHSDIFNTSQARAPARASERSERYRADESRRGGAEFKGTSLEMLERMNMRPIHLTFLRWLERSDNERSTFRNILCCTLAAQNATYLQIDKWRIGRISSAGLYSNQTDACARLSASACVKEEVRSH